MTDNNGSGFVFDADAAQRAVDFFAECLMHVKGEHAGRPFILEPWQQDELVRPLFGWKRPDGTRRYREAYVEIPKKNGKSSLAAGIALYLLFADGEPGAEVISAAGDKDQARIVFGDAKAMRAASAELRKRSKAYKDSIVVHATGSTYRAVSSDAPTKHGINPHGIMFDELHVQSDRELWDTLVTGIASRRQPLAVALTTAGYDRRSLCWEKHEYARKILEGSLEDPAFLAVIYAADAAADWRAPATWRKANPNLNVSVKESYLRDQVRKAEESLPYQNTFRRLHLNVWTEQAQRAIDMDSWNAGAEPLDVEALRGRRCFAGLDLASTTDVAAFVLLFPPLTEDEPYQIVSRFWVPAENLVARVKRDRVPYDVWMQQGLLEATEGNVIDYDVIRQRIREDGDRFDIREIAFDRWGAVQLTTQLQGDGFTVVPIGQGFHGMAAPTKEFLSLVAARRLVHGGHPVLRWMASNVSVKQDAAGNLKPDKGASAEKIDGVVALIMALARAIVQPEMRSVYESRGVLVLGGAP